MLNAKIIEEANELAQASNRDHVANELADLIYFSLVKVGPKKKGVLFLFLFLVFFFFF
jgi:phosphoribosyl-ATP pyrophosphohydrolase